MNSEELKERKRNWYHKNKARIKEIKTNNMLCHECSNKAVPGRKRCDKHLKRNVKSVKLYRKTENGKDVHRHTDARFRRRWRRNQGRYKYVTGHMNRKGKEWSINEEDYSKLLIMDCFYCGLENTSEAGVGLDRLDNSSGYHIDNVVPCCTECNLARNTRFSIEEMKIIGRVIREVKLSRRPSSKSMADE